MVSIFLVCYPLSPALRFVAAPFTGALPLWLRVLITVVVATPLMTSVLLPLVTRALRPWLVRGRVRGPRLRS